MATRGRGKPASVSTEVIAEIYRLYDNENLGYAKISKRLNVGFQLVRYYIVKRKKINQAADTVSATE